MHTRAGLLFVLLGASAGGGRSRRRLIGALALQQPAPAVRQPRPAPRPVRPPGGPAYSPIAADIARWNSLRQSDNLPFSSYASFLLAPSRLAGRDGDAAHRRAAASPSAARPPRRSRFFSDFPPLTPAGHARHAFALPASGRADEARTDGAAGLDRRRAARRPTSSACSASFGGALDPAGP